MLNQSQTIVRHIPTMLIPEDFKMGIETEFERKFAGHKEGLKFSVLMLTFC